MKEQEANKIAWPNPIPETLTLHHASAEKNIPSIVEKGIIPKGKSACEQAIDGILSDLGLTREDIPDSIWKEPLERCKETESEVYLSIDEDYAKGNCLAGLEAEYQLRAKIRRERGEDTSPKAVMGEIQCKSCKVQVPIESLTTTTVEGLQGRARSVLRYYTREHPEWSEGQIKKEAFKRLFDEVTLDKVPPEWIKQCGKAFKGEIMFPVPSAEDTNKK